MGHPVSPETRKKISNSRIGKCTGQEHWRWKGGRNKTTAGYVDISVSGSRIAEHRAIMETKIGRKLRKGENVHHINGIRDDNRPENLELWTVVQPTGIRFDDRFTDLVEFALAHQ